MFPPKGLLKTKDYCKRYREKNRVRIEKNDAKRKRAQREKVKLLNPELHECEKKGV